jgi:NTP pyrophosphatase (non-canonical NTP hydrolase)
MACGEGCCSERITSKNYVELACVTESPVTPELTARISDPKMIRLLHAGIGINTEAGEFIDMIKKHVYYGKPIDLTNLFEELGDTLWYVAIALDALGKTMDEAMATNIAKLSARYPEKFTEHHAENRDLDTERAILETGYQPDYSERDE